MRNHTSRCYSSQVQELISLWFFHKTYKHWNLLFFGYRFPFLLWRFGMKVCLLPCFIRISGYILNQPVHPFPVYCPPVFDILSSSRRKNTGHETSTGMFPMLLFFKNTGDLLVTGVESWCEPDHAGILCQLLFRAATGQLKNQSKTRKKMLNIVFG